MKENIILEKSYKFAVRIAKPYLFLKSEKKEYEEKEKFVIPNS